MMSVRMLCLEVKVSNSGMLEVRSSFKVFCNEEDACSPGEGMWLAKMPSKVELLCLENSFLKRLTTDNLVS